MIEKIRQLKDKAIQEIKQSKGPIEMEKIWRKYLGRQGGELTRILRGLKDLSINERPKIGSFANQTKKEIEDFLNEKKQNQGNFSEKNKENSNYLLPGKKIDYGHLHPLTQIRYEIADIFSSLGFEILEGPEVETDYYNFEALNIPAGHPARDMWDTFYLKSEERKNKNKWLLRTHTSTMQVRVMEKNKPPLKICVIGRCFRHEATDASHEHTLHQVEGFIVDKEITVANLIYVLKNFLNALFNREVKIRLRPSYFPFTEPSFEVDFACLNCQGKGCPVCKHTGWVEILGSGMIHPKVFQYAGYPKGKYTGFAFGMGLDRLAMMKYQIDDIRLFHSGDLRFINQF
ncbi:MAG: phenylalanine--tRNA ligase subunit alpha [Patescibacteria group bacterium]|jgi:phenylalanyl-tRNA synthetase alpha chain|nr:phenylalanine--tRNA ligase subunit alpha [Patescibacteria group bacterium]MDD5172648.1 phenylalanine--tRNA ligase subunit alpha [Patescibacteria group bacterium]